MKGYATIREVLLYLTWRAREKGIGLEELAEAAQGLGATPHQLQAYRLVLMTSSVAETARKLGVSRQALHDLLKRLRPKLEEAYRQLSSR